MHGHLEITTRIGCRLACSFCPQKTLVTAYDGTERVMSLENFTKIISTVPKSVDIHFSGFAEPFLNPLTPRMMALARAVGHKMHVYSTLVGMTAEGAEIVKEVKPDFIRIHIADQKAMKVADDKWIEAHELFLSTGLEGSYMAMGTVTDKVAEYLNSKGIRYEVPQMLSRGGNVAVVAAPNLEGNIVCGMDRWHQNVVLPDGNVYTCCMDYGLTMPVGNLLTQDYQEIYDKAETYKANVNPPANSICRSCEWARKI